MKKIVKLAIFTLLSVFSANAIYAQTSTTAGDWFELGRNQFAQKRYNDAIKSFTKCIALNPKAEGCFGSRGLVYLRLQKHQLAVNDFTRVISIAPKFASAYNNRGIAYYELKNTKAALSDISKAIQLDPSMANSYFVRSVIYCQKGNLSLAKRDEQKAIQLGWKFKKLCAANANRNSSNSNQNNSANKRKGKLTFERPTYAGEKIYYQGEIVNGKANGYGEATTSYGHRYVGNWKNNDFHGYGKLYFKSGNIYDGYWRNGRRTTNAVMTFANGDTYSGEWRNFKFHGKGTYIWNSSKWKGHKYVGEWQNGKRHGYGKYTYPNGTIREGFFENNVFKGKAIKKTTSQTQPKSIINRNLSDYDNYKAIARKLRQKGNGKTQSVSDGDIQWALRYEQKNPTLAKRVSADLKRERIQTQKSNQNNSRTPKTELGWLSLGKTLLTQKKYKDAVGVYTKCIQRYPKSIGCLNGRVAAHYELKLYSIAAKDVTRIINIKPNKELFYLRGVLNVMEINKDPVLTGFLNLTPKPAINDFTEAIKLDPKYRKAYEKRANAYCLFSKWGFGVKNEDRKIYVSKAKADERKVIELGGKIAKPCK